jgi:hypothetical protein
VSTAATLGEELAQLGLAVAEARAHLAAGRDLGLAAFAERVEALCTEIAGRPREEALRYGPVLLRLRDELDGLAAEVRELLRGPDGRTEDPTEDPAEDPADDPADDPTDHRPQARLTGGN